MSKTNKRQNHIKQKPTGVKKVKTYEIYCRLRKIPYFVLLFVALWVFCSFVYGSVFYMSQQSSFFAFDKTLLFSVLNQDFAWLNVLGRFLLLSFHYPIFGGAVLSLMLTLSAWLFDYLLGLKDKTHWIAVLLPFAFLGYFVYLDYSVNYMRETSVLMGWPALALLLLAVAAGVKRIFTRKRITAIYRVAKNDTSKATLLTCAAIVVALIGFTWFSLDRRENIIKTCRMQRQLEQSDWDAMIGEAVSARRPARSVAAYHALALAETGQLENRLFDIVYDFPKTTVKAPGMSENDGVSIYCNDCDFYAGLVNSSYHGAMETFVKCGPQVLLLKYMARAAAMNGEGALCRKYLDILSCCMVENKFVERFSAYADDTELMYNDPEFAHVAAKMPLSDSFEQNYRAPYFIGYNVALTEGRSEEALRTSIMACLYAKETEFVRKAELLRGAALSPYLEQALMVQGVKNPQLLEGYGFDKRFVLSRLESFIKEARPWMKNKKEGVAALKENWKDYYPFYLYFQNLPAEQKEANHNKEKEGVN